MSFSATLARHLDVVRTLGELEPELNAMAERVYRCVSGQGKVLFMGNGGSAADCQHLATEFVVRYKEERRPLASLALTVDTSILTAHSNDYGFDSVFVRQIQALARPEDVIIGLSTSGNSANVIQGIEAARALGCFTYAWTGQSGGKLLDIADVTLRMPTTETARVQEAHMIIGHWLCEEMDRRFV